MEECRCGLVDIGEERRDGEKDSTRNYNSVGVDKCEEGKEGEEIRKGRRRG